MCVSLMTRAGPTGPGSGCSESGGLTRQRRSCDICSQNLRWGHTSLPYARSDPFCPPPMGCCVRPGRVSLRHGLQEPVGVWLSPQRSSLGCSAAVPKPSPRTTSEKLPMLSAGTTRGAETPVMLRPRQGGHIETLVNVSRFNDGSLKCKVVWGKYVHIFVC